MTTYHIRTVKDKFSWGYDSGPSYITGFSEMGTFEAYVENRLDAVYKDVAIRTNPANIFNTVNQELFFYITNDNQRALAPSYSTVSASNVISQIGTENYIYWSNYLITSTSANYNTESWNGKGWGDPIVFPTTFNTRLCEKFDSINKNNIVTNNSNINLVIFKYQFTNYPLKGSDVVDVIFPVFYAGNDPLAETTVVI
jgi:hypothetical protein